MLVVPRDETNIIYSNVPELDSNIELYDSNKIYSLDDIVQYQGYIYESIKEDNNDEPLLNSNSLSWMKISRTNKYKMFDDLLSTTTSFKDKLIYEFLVDDIDTVCFFGLVAQNVKIELYSYDELVYTKEESTYMRYVSNWWEWSVQKAKQKNIIYFNEIPSFYNAKLKVTIDNNGSFASCSHLVFGKSLDFGFTLTNPKPTSSIRNLVSKNKQKDGSVRIEASKTYKRVVLNVLIDVLRIDEFAQFLEKHSLEPMLFISERQDNLEALIVFGFFKDFEQAIGLNFSEFQIEIEGIV